MGRRMWTTVAVIATVSVAAFGMTTGAGAVNYVFRSIFGNRQLCNGAPNEGPVFTDAYVNSLSGNAGDDWYFANPSRDRFLDAESVEANY